MSFTQRKQKMFQQPKVVTRWLWAVLFSFVVLVEAQAAPQLESAFPIATSQVTNGPVLTSASFGSHTNQPTGNGIGLDASTALVDTRFPKVSGGAGINVIIDDGFGGWVIGGNFTDVGGVALTNLAHIQADFSVNSAWRPNPDGEVYALLFHTGLRGLRLLVGGNFSTIHGVTRTYFAELNSGSISKPVTDINLFINAPVRAIVKDELVYIGGDFTDVRGRVELDENHDGIIDHDIDGNGIIDVDLNKDNMPDPGGIANIDLNGDGVLDGDDQMASATPVLYTRPLISEIGPRKRIAALDLDAASNDLVVADWNPNVSGTVSPSVNTMALAPERGRLYIGGSFTEIAVGTGATVLRKSIAALNIRNNINIITTWNPGDTTNTITINTMLLEEFVLDENSGEDVGLLYVGGLFNKIGGQARINFAALDISLAVNNANLWDVEFDAEVRALARTTETIFVGGDFTTVTSEGTVTINYSYLAGVKREDGTLLTSWNPQLDGQVNALAVNGNTLYAGGSFNSIGDKSRLYIGGDFTYIGPSTGSGVVVDPSPASGVVQSGWPEIDGDVYVAIPDGNNGWYVGGSFSRVGSEVRNNIARINSNQSVNAWNPNADGSVRAMVLSGSDVYVGGDFVNIGGEARNRLALINSSGNADSAWNPDIDGPVPDKTGPITVYSIVLNGTVLYAGGNFTDVGGGSTRNRLAAFDLAAVGNEDVATGWNPNANGTVRAMVLSGSDIYVGGDFTSIGSEPTRNYIALIDNTGVATAWNPNANDIVRTLELSGAGVYVGGDFTNIGGVSRNNIAELDGAGAATGWNPNANGSVSEILLDGSVVYVGGDFTFIGSLLRNRAAAVSTGSNVATDWDPSVGNTVHALSLSGATNIFIGGAFSSVGGVTRERLAAFDASSGVLDPNFDVGTDAAVKTMTLSGDGSTLYVGGDFTAVGGQQRNHIAALDTATGGATLWNPNVDGSAPTTTVNDIELTPQGDLLYVGGLFETIGMATRNNIGAIEIEGATQTAWNPSVDGEVNAMALSGDTLLIGGDFLNVNTNGQNVARSRLAALNTQANTDNATPWAPAADARVRAMTLAGSTLYIGGDFNNINDSGFTRTRKNLAAIDTAANAFNVLGWNPDANASVYSIALTNDALFVGGAFTTVSGTARTRVAALNFTNGAALEWWHLKADDTVKHLGLNGAEDRMIIAGDFRQITTVENFPPYSADQATVLRRGLTAVDVAFPHAVTNPPAGAYQAAQSVAMRCIDTPKPCPSDIYYESDGSTPIVNGAPPVLQSYPVTIDTALKLVALDDVGNQSAVQTSLYVIDSEGPGTAASPAGPLPDGKILSGNDVREIRLTCDDVGAAGCAETYYTIDGTTPTGASNVYIAPIIMDENTTLKYFSFDQARNREDTIKEEQYWLDLRAPTVVADPPTRVFYSANLAVTLLCSDDPEVTEVSIGAIPDASNPPNPNDPPITGVTSIEDEQNRTVTGCSGVYYTLDDSTPTLASALYTGPVSFSGNTVVKFIAIDRAGNVGLVQRASYIKNYSDNAGAVGPLGLSVLLLPWLFRRAQSRDKRSNGSGGML